MKLWEPTDVVRFEYDGGSGFWFQCPHMETAHRLPIGGEKGWTVREVDPLSILPSISVGGCGCHGFITFGKWRPV